MPDRKLRVSAVVADAFDGAARLLGDAQRFGFSIRGFHLDTVEGEGASIRMTLAVPMHADTDHIRSRFARHATVVSLEAA